MWEQLKKKLMQWFDSDTQSTSSKAPQEKADINKAKTIQTRMTYQYPSENSFKFPIVPDTPKSHERQIEKKKRNKLNDTPMVNKIDKVDNKPHMKFKASEVPSPIYGFNSRPKQDELEIPAYIRKEAKSYNEEIITVGLASNSEYEDQQDSKETSTHHSKSNDTKNEKTVKEVDHNRMERQTITENHTQRRNFKSTVTPSVDSKEKRKEERPSHASIKKPINVMMTPRDKKKSINQNHQQLQSQNSTTVPLHLLNDLVLQSNEDSGWVEQQKNLLETTLKYFHIKANVVGAVSGPSVTRFEIQPEPGVKVSKIKNLSDDIKLNLAAKDIRIEAPIPGKNTIGIEVPNPVSQPVMLQQLFEVDSFRNSHSPLTVALGLDIAGNPILTDLNKMPHGLIAGATGSGKSVCINTILVSLLYKANQEDVRFLLIDPKMVELAPYNDIPHLVSPVITDVKAATKALKWAVEEMEDRYQRFVLEGARDMERYNQKMDQQNRTEEKMPYLVIVIDELADLMMVSPQEVEDSICRIAQKARAAGIHLLLATQRPSVDVITGLIKSNIPTRIAFSVASQVDSRTIIDTSGAEKLLGKGDMLFVENGARQSVRIQGAFVSDEEIERVTEFVKKTASPNYLFEQEQLLYQIDSEDEDEIYSEVVEFIVQQKGASASLLQRHFKIGYNRAARLIDHLESAGIISEQKGSKPRDILITEKDVEEVLSQ